MIKTLNKSILIWIIVILAATNISTVGTIVYFVYFQGNTVQYKNSPQIDIPDSHIGRFFRDELNLNRKQHDQFRIFRQNFHEEANILSNKMQVNRNEIMTELGKENSDTIYLHTLAREIGEMHEELKHLTFEYYLEMKNICTIEQKEKLFQIFRTMINQDDEIEMPDKKLNNF
jgi:Spy/CpxP family protein refolding chaperone